MNNQSSKSVNNSVLPHGIKTAKTVEEFRKNLRKYFVCIKNEELYVRQKSGVKINELNCLSDLYEKVEFMDGTPRISVKVNPLKDLKEFMRETNQRFSTIGYFLDEKNFEIIDNQDDFMLDYNPLWIGIDNQIYREFFILTLGEFSGYSVD